MALNFLVRIGQEGTNHETRVKKFAGVSTRDGAATAIIAETTTSAITATNQGIRQTAAKERKKRRKILSRIELNAII